MKLEVGKKYVSREGEVVEIICNHPRNDFPMNGSDDMQYAEDGSFLYDRNHKYDLVSEYIEPRDMVSDFVSDGWGRLHGAEARIKELEAELDALKTVAPPPKKFTDVYYYFKRAEEAEARIKELEAELDAYKPKPVMISEWANVFASTIGPWRRYCEALVDGCGILMIIRRDTTTHPNGNVSTTYHKEEI